MAGWGIESAATQKKNLKQKWQIIYGLNATGEIIYSTYSELFDFH